MSETQHDQTSPKPNWRATGQRIVVYPAAPLCTGDGVGQEQIDQSWPFFDSGHAQWPVLPEFRSVARWSRFRGSSVGNWMRRLSPLGLVAWQQRLGRKEMNRSRPAAGGRPRI